jgi:hypothetical protein
LWVPAANRSSVTHVEQRNDTTAWQWSARGDDGSGTCKRPARLDGRLSSDGRSVRRREHAAGNIQIASSRGSVQPRLEGWIHNKVEGVEAHLALLDTAAKKVRWSRGRRLRGLGLMQGKQSSTTPSPACLAPIPRWRLDHGRLQLGVGVPGSGCSGFAAATHGRTTTRTCGFGLLHEWPPDPSPYHLLLPLHERRNGGSCTASQPTHHSGPRLHPCLLHLLSSSNSSLLIQPGGGYNGFGERNPKGGHTGSRLGIFIGRLLGFEGASGRCRCGTGGDAAASGAPARQGVAPMAGVSTAVLPPPRHRHEAR